MMGTHIAARTERLRIGMGVSLTPFYHPLRLAEEVALLDVLSGGRVNWGAGRGFDPRSTQPLAWRAKTVIRSSASMSMWYSKPGPTNASYEGEFVSSTMSVLPKPLQDPHPPTWVATSRMPSLGLANRATATDGPARNPRRNRRKRRLYEDELLTAGHVVNGRDIPVARNIALGSTQAEAEAIARKGAEFMFGNYLRKPDQVRSKTQEKTIDIASVSPADDDPEKRVERYINEVVICGTPEKVADDLEQYRESMKLNCLLCSPLGSSFMLFTEKVLPKFL